MDKKFILFIVEGKNDRIAIEAMLHTEYFANYREKYKVEFIQTNGDLTTDKAVNEKNVQEKLNKLLLDFRRNGVPFSNIKPQDIQEIVQVVDLDGAFVQRADIIQGKTDKFFYTEESIITSNVDGAWGRNRKKVAILNKLIDVNRIGNVPYSIYFVSCNMDHVVFDKRNLEPYEKSNGVRRFQKECADKPRVLEESIFKEGVGTNKTFLESWVEIKEERKSLQRHTNFNLYFGSGAKNSK